MAQERKKTFWDDFKTFFTRGLAILLPSVLTLALLWWAYGFLRDRVAEPINTTVRQVVIWGTPLAISEERLPDWYAVTDLELAERRAERDRQGFASLTNQTIEKRVRADAFAQWWHERWYMQAIGFVVALVLIYLAGLLVGNLIGRRTVAKVESFISSLPLFKQVYPSIKQVVEFLLGGEERMLQSNRVVALEYPRKGVWSIGLMTGETMRSIEAIAGEECVTIFIPSSPTPFTGYTITVPKSSVVELPVSLDEALKFCVSGGVLVPASEVIGREPQELLQAKGPSTQATPQALTSGDAGAAHHEGAAKTGPCEN